MQAVGRVQFQPALTTIIINLNFIDIARAKPGAGAAVLGITGVYAKIGVVHNDMGWLIFTVLGFGQIDTGEFVHLQLAVKDFGIDCRPNINLLAVKRLERLIIFLKGHVVHKTTSAGEILSAQMDKFHQIGF